MATYAIGDVHGCFRELQLLLRTLEFDWEEDSLWLVGDLVNRGPDSLRTLRWARKSSKRLGGRFRMVLGNHDLHLIAMSMGLVRPRRGDTAKEILANERASRLIEWLAKQPLAFRHGDFLLVHAGLWPDWKPKHALAEAEKLSAILSKRRRRAQRLLTKEPSKRAARRLASERRALEGLTRLRMCGPQGEACDFTGPPSEAPDGCVPWFQAPGRKSSKVTVICGHWAALGLRIEERLLALDTGCVWGGALTAVRLEDRAVFSQRALNR